MELWYTEEHTDKVRFSIKVDEQLYSGKSDFQRIDVFKSQEFGTFFTLDGLMMVTEKDEFIYHDMIVHAHKDKRDPRGNSSKLFGCFKPVQAVFCKHDIHKYGVEKTGAESL